jgi:pyruvate formate lyase activating enzyme
MALKQRKISVNVETSLHVKWSDIARCLGLVGTFLVDLKHIDSAKFRTFTRGDTKLVTENLVRLTESGEKVIVRIPVIPDFNHTLAEMEMIIDFASSLNGLKEVHFLPYHALGSEKYRMLGREYPYRIYSRVPETELYPYLEYARAKGLKTQTGG